MRAPRNLGGALAGEFRMLDVTAELLESAAELPRHHADPFDHALSDDLSVLTHDPVFADYGVRVAADHA